MLGRLELYPNTPWSNKLCLVLAQISVNFYDILPSAMNTKFVFFYKDTSDCPVAAWKYVERLGFYLSLISSRSIQKFNRLKLTIWITNDFRKSECQAELGKSGPFVLISPSGVIHTQMWYKEWTFYYKENYYWKKPFKANLLTMYSDIGKNLECSE